jgi:hypothetical protein
MKNRESISSEAVLNSLSSVSEDEAWTNARLILRPFENTIVFPLAGVGVQNPDGTWNETPYGELIVDANGEPILDDNGNKQYGHFIANGWYRLHTNYHVHSHPDWETCLETAKATDTIVHAGYEKQS